MRPIAALEIHPSRSVRSFDEPPLRLQLLLQDLLGDLGRWWPRVLRRGRRAEAPYGAFEATLASARRVLLNDGARLFLQPATLAR